ncbi:MAG: DUF302 domain-containing protein [Anaerolineales bacterium]
MKRMYVLLAVILLLTVVAGGAAAQAPGVEGLVTVEVEGSVAETVAALEEIIEEQGLLLVSTVDHMENAAGVDLELRPTQLLIFGNPQLGTQLMQDEQSVGIDLPQKRLVWEDEDGAVYVSYNAPEYLRTRHGLDESGEVLSTISNALAGLAESATGAEEAAEGTPETLPAAGGRGSLLPWALVGGGAVLLGIGWRLRRNGGWALFLLAFAVPLLGLALSGTAHAQEGVRGLVVVDSPYDVAETVSRAQDAMEERGLTIMMTVDHGANAEGADLELRPTQLIVFGNPQLGTQLMQAGQSVGIDLPQKMLVWEDAEGQVHLAYNDPQYLAQRHNLSGVDEVLSTISGALSAIAEEATAE